MKAILPTVMYVLFCSVLFYCYAMLCYICMYVCMYVCMYENHFATLPLHSFHHCRYHAYDRFIDVDAFVRMRPEATRYVALCEKHVEWDNLNMICACELPV